LENLVRRIIRFFSVAAVLVTAMATQPASVSASSASGVSTATALVPPPATTGLTLRTVTSARDGGMYFAYQNATGDDYSLVKQKADKTFDSSFGVGGVATVPGLSATQYSSRRVLITSDLNEKWWAVSSPGTSIGTTSTVVIATGGATAQPPVSNTLNASSLASLCAAAYPTLTPPTWSVGSASVLVKRGSGAWVSLFCTGTISSTLVNVTTLIAVKADLTVDSSISPIGLNGLLGSSVVCHSPATVSDPTGVASSPELWVVRTEHTKVTNGLCDVQPTSASQVSGYDVLRISGTGVITRTTFASPDDASKASFTIRLDPGGRPLLVGTTYSDATKMTLVRLNTNGALDTTVGTNGFTTLPIGAVPAGAVSVRANPIGIITSASNVYLTILLTDNQKNSFNCSTTTPVVTGLRIAVVSFANGPASTFGTSGVSDRVTASNPENAICFSALITAGSSVNNAGNPRVVISDNAVFKYAEWSRPSDATGGSDGGSGTGGFTRDTGGAPSSGTGAAARVDTKVYSTKLPAVTQPDSALTVLTAKQSKDLDIRTSTPKICIALTTSVMMVNPGRCVVRIIDEDTRRVLRTMTTTVKKAEVEAGTTLTTDEPIMFKQANIRLSKTALAQVAELAEAAKTASRVVVIGHSAALGDVSAYSFAISRDRANAVKAALIKAGVKVPIETVALSYNQPETTKKTEAAQAKNRRAEVFIFP
jgi:outer membrane protein OmpA-like peptidoglycan-associated protein